MLVEHIPFLAVLGSHHLAAEPDAPPDPLGCPTCITALEDGDRALGPPLRVSYLGLLPLLYALNLFWWYQICKAIQKMVKRKERKES